MKPQDGLFEEFAADIFATTPDLYRQEDFRLLSRDIVDAARDRNRTISMPGLAHVRYAVNRELHAMGTGDAFPRGKIYELPEYDECTPSTSDEHGLVGPTYVSRLLVATGDEVSGKAISFLGRVLDETFDEQPKKSGTYAIIHTLTPKDVQNIYTARSITFILLQSASGENFFFTLTSNPERGMVMADQAMASDDRLPRELMGAIDTVSLKALPCSPVTIQKIKAELLLAKDTAKGRPETTTPISTSVVERSKWIGERALAFIKGYGRRRADS